MVVDDEVDGASTAGALDVVAGAAVVAVDAVPAVVAVVVVGLAVVVVGFVVVVVVFGLAVVGGVVTGGAVVVGNAVVVVVAGGTVTATVVVSADAPDPNPTESSTKAPSSPHSTSARTWVGMVLTVLAPGVRPIPPLVWGGTLPLMFGTRVRGPTPDGTPLEGLTVPRAETIPRSHRLQIPRMRTPSVHQLGQSPAQVTVHGSQIAIACRDRTWQVTAGKRLLRSKALSHTLSAPALLRRARLYLPLDACPLLGRLAVTRERNEIHLLLKSH